ncbi:hypothetical protein NKH48_18230 [Mesorhizobium sp. M1233]|uniref:SLOG cluster 4 domain-containing protein n=1 Tax=Mesorhizobium sp. M1233 TaxID=2957072 RepID=UPI00333BF230
MVTVSVACGGSDVDPNSPAALRAASAGRVIAQLGCDLITGGGGGSMAIVAEHFCGVANRTGRSVGILPGSATGFENAVLGAVTEYVVVSKYSPTPWIEIPIYTHLPGGDPKGPKSRNILNMQSGRIVVVLAGGDGTQAEFEMALGLRKPVIAFVADGDRIGRYARTELPEKTVVVQNESSLRSTLQEMLLRQT